MDKKISRVAPQRVVILRPGDVDLRLRYFKFNGRFGQVLIAFRSDDSDIFQADAAPFGIVQPRLYGDDVADQERSGGGARQGRGFMHFQADAMACTVEESVRRLGLRVGRKAISVKYLRDGFMDLCTGDAGPEHGQGGLLGFVDGVKSAANDFWRFAFDYGAGQVAAIAGRIVPREDVQRDWRVCLDGAVALLVRVSSLLAVGGDRVGRCAATARFQRRFRLESFCQEGLSLQEQNFVPTDFRLSENIRARARPCSVRRTPLRTYLMGFASLLGLKSDFG